MTRPPMIGLRPAEPDDESLLLAWANDPVTRAAGFRPDPIPVDDHRRWFGERLQSTSGRLWIGMADDRPVGQIRLDLRGLGRVEVGISVAPEARGRGIGRELLRAGLEAARADPALEARTFVARIRPENTASIALFSGAGFGLVATTDVDGMACLVYETA